MPSSSSLTLIHPLNPPPPPPPPPMEWFSWLSRTNLEPSLIYDYGVIFARNQLQLEDASFFNHEFLQSMGVSIAKHRLEIIKLARSDYSTRHHRPNKKLSGVIKNYMRKCLRKLVPFRDEAPCYDHRDFPGTPEPANWYHNDKWRGAMERKQGSDEFQKESNNNTVKPAMNRTRSIALSGPLDGRMMNEKLANTNKVLRLSGPLDGKRHDRLLYPNRSPLVSCRPVSGPVKSPRSSGALDPRLVMMECRSPRLSRPDSPLSFSPYLNKTKGDFDFDEDDHTLWPTLFQDLKPT